MKKNKNRDGFRGILIATPGVELAMFSELSGYLKERGVQPEQLTVSSPLGRVDLEPLLKLMTPPIKVVVVTTHERLLFADLLQRWKCTEKSLSALHDRGNADAHAESISRFSREVLPVLRHAEISGQPPVTWVSATYTSRDQVLQLVAHAFGF